MERRDEKWGNFVIYIAFVFGGSLIKTPSGLANVNLTICKNTFVHNSHFACGHQVPVLLGTAFVFFFSNGVRQHTENDIQVKRLC